MFDQVAHGYKYSVMDVGSRQLLPLSCADTPRVLKAQLMQQLKMQHALTACGNAY